MCRKSLFPLIISFFIFFSWCIPKAEAATLLYSNGFDGQFGDVSKMYNCQPHAYTLVTSPKKSGTHAIKFTSYGDDSDMCWEWGNTEKKHRVQLQLGINNAYPGYPKGLRIYPNDVGPWWVGFSMYVPSSIPTGIFIIFDIKARTGFGEPTAFFYNNKLDVRLEGGVANNKMFVLPRDQWVDIVWMIERRNNSNGKMKFWLNGKLELDQTGKTIPDGFSNVESWFRIGIYYNKDAKRAGHTYITYFDNVKIAKGVDGYSLVAPSGTPVPPPPGVPSGVKVSKTLSSAN